MGGARRARPRATTARRHGHRHVVRRLGAERARRARRRRLQLLGRPRPPDALARLVRGVGAVRARRRRPGTATSSRSSARDGRWRQKADPMALATEVPPATASVVADRAYDVGRRGLDGATRAAPTRTAAPMSDLRGAPRVRGGPGCVLPRAGRRSSSTTSPTWASPTSSCCPWPSTRSAARGATRSRPTTRRRRASAPRTTSGCLVDRAAPGRHRRHRRLGAGALPQGRLGAGPLRRHRALRARRPAPRASSPTGARSSSTSAATRCATSWSPTRCTGSRSSTSTGCGSTPSPRCSTSTTRRKDGEWVPNQLRRPREPRGGRVPAGGQRDRLQAGRPASSPSPRSRPRGRASPRPTHLGGLGFGLKWNMGWMHDTLALLRRTTRSTASTTTTR